jgi:hypothetical protein
MRVEVLVSFLWCGLGPIVTLGCSLGRSCSWPDGSKKYIQRSYKQAREFAGPFLYFCVTCSTALYLQPNRVSIIHLHFHGITEAAYTSYSEPRTERNSYSYPR